MPIDGISLNLKLDSFEHLQRAMPGLQWVTPIDLKTGHPSFSNLKMDKGFNYQYQTIVHTSEFEGLMLKVREIVRIPTNNNRVSVYECILQINGSLHKHFATHNHGQFNFNDLQFEIDRLVTLFNVNLLEAEIGSIEFGVNLVTEFPPQSLISNLLTYKGNSFNRYKDKRIGKYCPLKSDFEIKIYNKAYQQKTNGNILRFELHFQRMRTLHKCGIKYLKDLQNHNAVYSLIQPLADTWAHILTFPSVNDKSALITAKDKDFLAAVRPPEYWEELYSTISRPAIKKKRDRLRAIDQEHGSNIHCIVSNQIKNTWADLFPAVVTDNADVRNKLRLTNVRGDIADKVNDCPIKMIETNVILPKRECQTCFRDISNQKANTKFCSQKLYGKDAKRCRNKNSNPRNNFKLKLIKLEKRGLLFDISPYMVRPKKSVGPSR